MTIHQLEVSADSGKLANPVAKSVMLYWPAPVVTAVQGQRLAEQNVNVFYDNRTWNARVSFRDDYLSLCGCFLVLGLERATNQLSRLCCASPYGYGQ